jgi:hypothetical protein
MLGGDEDITNPFALKCGVFIYHQRLVRCWGYTAIKRPTLYLLRNLRSIYPCSINVTEGKKKKIRLLQTLEQKPGHPNISIIRATYPVNSWSLLTPEPEFARYIKVGLPFSCCKIVDVLLVISSSLASIIGRNASAESLPPEVRATSALYNSTVPARERRRMANTCVSSLF